MPNLDAEGIVPRHAIDLQLHEERYVFPEAVALQYVVDPLSRTIGKRPNL